MPLYHLLHVGRRGGTQHCLRELVVGHGEAETLEFLLEKRFIHHLLEHVLLHLGYIDVGIAALLHLLLLLLYAFLEFKVVDFLTVYFCHGVAVGEEFTRAVNCREDEEKQSHTQNRDDQDGALTDLFKC